MPVGRARVELHDRRQPAYPRFHPAGGNNFPSLAVGQLQEIPVLFGKNGVHGGVIAL
jgi:hypothetical protein